MHQMFSVSEMCGQQAGTNTPILSETQTFKLSADNKSDDPSPLQSRRCSVYAYQN